MFEGFHVQKVYPKTSSEQCELESDGWVARLVQSCPHFPLMLRTQQAHIINTNSVGIYPSFPNYAKREKKISLLFLIIKKFIFHDIENNKIEEL